MQRIRASGRRQRQLKGMERMNVAGEYFSGGCIL